LTLLDQAGLPRSFLGSSLGLEELTLGVIQLLLIGFELGEERRLFQALLFAALAPALPRCLLTVDEGVERGLDPHAHELHPAPGDAAQAEEGVLGAHDQRGDGERRDEDDGADGGEEPRQEPAEITAEHAARIVGPAGRSEERRVGKEWRGRGGAEEWKEKEQT